MEIKVDLNTKTAVSLVADGLQAQILAGAVAQIMKELTPDRLEAWVLTVFKDATKYLSAYRVQQELHKMAEPMLLEVLKTPEIEVRLRVAVKEGVEGAIGALPEKIKTQLIESAVKNLEANIRGR